MGRVAPTGTVTLLFTDVEGSTDLWESAPESMRVALRRHDEIVTATIDAHGGHVFATGGDAFCAAFSEPTAAVEAAAALQRALGGETWPAGAEIRVRVGLHSGIADERNGDYFGPTPNRCARLMAAAHGGQVVMSRATAELVRRTHRTVEVGRFDLRGVPEPTPIHQLVGQGLRRSFPPLRARPMRRSNLPTFGDRFVGRRGDLDRVSSRLAERRLVTVTAPGGTGKTRLAVEAAAALVDEFRDGVWLVDLVGAAEGDVAERIGRAMGFERREATDWTTTAADWLSVREALVVLDNCEHVLADAARTVERALAQGDRIRFLTTSREALGLREEAVVPLDPLEPDAAGVELFVDRARAADDRFDPQGSDEEIRDLVRRLDGLPLAIELAAARVRTLPPAEMLARLDDRFDLLRRRGPLHEHRHRALSTTIEWSYDLLTPGQQRFFERLSIFAGSFDARAAAAVAGDGADLLSAIEAIDDLEAKSLVRGERDERARYRLLETLAAFGRARLFERGDDETTRSAHSRWYVDRAAESLDVLGELPPRDANRRVRELLDELPELHQALRHEMTESPARALGVALEVARSLWTLRELRAATPFLGLVGELADLDPTGRAMSWAAMDGMVDSDSERMNRLAHHVLDGSTDPVARAHSHTVMGWVELVVGDERDAGLGHVRAGLDELARAPDDDAAVPLMATTLTTLLGHAGEHDRARDTFEALVEPMRSHVPFWDVLVAEAGAVAYRVTDLERSSGYLRRAIDIADELGLTGSRAFASYHLALNHVRARDLAAAVDRLVTCLPDLLDEGEALATALALEDLAAVLGRLDRPADALVALGAGTVEGERRGATGPAVYVRRRARIHERAEDALGAAAAAGAWQRGRTMTIDAAVAWARGLGGSAGQ